MRTRRRYKHCKRRTFKQGALMMFENFNKALSNLMIIISFLSLPVLLVGLAYNLFIDFSLNKVIAYCVVMFTMLNLNSKLWGGESPCQQARTPMSPQSVEL